MKEEEPKHQAETWQSGPMGNETVTKEDWELDDQNKRNEPGERTESVDQPPTKTGTAQDAKKEDKKGKKRRV